MFLLHQWNIEALTEKLHLEEKKKQKKLNMILNKIEDRESILSPSDKEVIDVWGIMLMPGREFILWWIRILAVIVSFPL